jgi:hypothetical protein
VDEKRREYQRAYYLKNREALLEKQRARGKKNYQANPEAYRKRAKAWREKNPERAAEADRAYRAKNREKLVATSQRHYWDNRDHHLEQSWLRRLKAKGLTPDQYAALLEAQGHRCAICLAVEPMRGRRRMYVDHDHQTGLVRGLLCQRCNTAIGLMRDDPQLLTSAADYLIRSSSGATSTMNSPHSAGPSTD